MNMFCFQCQEAAKGVGCDVRGVCGKSPEVAKLQDLLIYIAKGISLIVEKGNVDTKLDELNTEIFSTLFMTITNANFDEVALEKQIRKMLTLRDELAAKTGLSHLHDATSFQVSTREEMLEKASKVGVLATEDEDVRSLREMIIYGLKGMA
ncbi:MAG TPA: hydroxylamine reductase, partial [Bacillota bacterium]|nr:hydroxylamine reductase [Bacillota bacterium]